MTNRQSKNQKERKRVADKRIALNKLRILIQKHHHYEKSELTRWTEFHTLKRTKELIEELEGAIKAMGRKLPQAVKTTELERLE